ncbi:MAG TPA: DMT family transporter [Thermoanaerobaculia bacterium]|nr:DMT family transporter [Thermoanaerobaculia bacterium]
MTAPAGVSVPRPEALRADLVLVLVTAIWGSTFIVNRLALETAPPLVFILVRFSLAGVVLLGFTRGRARTANLARDSAVIGVLLAIGIGSQITGQLFTTASKAAFVTGLSVPLTPVAGYLMTRKKPSRENLAGLVLAAAGFAVLTWPRGAAGWNRGDLLIVGTAVSYAILIVVMAETAPMHDVRWYSFGQIAAAAVAVGVARLALVPFLPGTGVFAAAESRPLALTPQIVAAILWMALVATVVTFLAQTWAQQRMPATHAAILFALEPVFTALFAAIVLGERMTGRDWSGAALVLLGIVVSELRFPIPART